MCEPQVFDTDPHYARAVGRHGAFIPRRISYQVTEHQDGTALLHITVWSQRQAPGERPPVEVTFKLEGWQRMALAVAKVARACQCRRPTQ